MSRGQEDWDHALRDALAIRAAYHNLMHLIDSWEHPRFENADQMLAAIYSIFDAHRARFDTVVGNCVSEHYSRIPDKTDEYSVE